jgi:hypothetical protein
LISVAHTAAIGASVRVVKEMAAGTDLQGYCSSISDGQTFLISNSYFLYLQTGGVKPCFWIENFRSLVCCLEFGEVFIHPDHTTASSLEAFLRDTRDFGSWRWFLSISRKNFVERYDPNASENEKVQQSSPRLET